MEIKKKRKRKKENRDWRGEWGERERVVLQELKGFGLGGVVTMRK